MKKRSMRLIALGLASLIALSGCGSDRNFVVTGKPGESTKDPQNPELISQDVENDAENADEDIADDDAETETEDIGDTEAVTDESGADTGEDASGTEDAENGAEAAEAPIEEHTEGKYPIKWELDSVYENPDEWNADYDKVMEMLKDYDSYRGKLNSAESISNYLTFTRLSELTAIQSKLNLYADLGSSLNPTDATFKEMSSKLDTMNAEESKLASFADPEIYSMPLSEREEIFSDPVFKGKEYWLRDYTDPDVDPLSEEENKLLATMSIGQGYPNTLFDILDSVEIPNPKITMPDGTKQELTDELYTDIIYSPDYDDEFKAKANQVILTKEKGFAGTFATLLEENCQQAYASAQIDGYESTLESAMAQYDLDTGVFNMLVDAAHEGAEDYRRYLNIHKKGLGLEQQFPYHMGTYVSDFDPAKTEYDDAVDEVIDALSVLGDDYTDKFTEIITSGHIDVYPTATKVSGAFETQPSKDYLPWVMFNYNGHSEDISTIAHEMGHAVYSELSNENQEPQYSEPTIFTHEVASTTNELLYYTYKMNNAKDDEEKLFYLENILSMFSGTFFTQMWYSEFEDYMYKQVEAGSALDPEDLGDKWMELLNTYRGDGITAYPDARYAWSSIPHFYYVYYVYQYAADVAYAASIAERITSGEEGAVEEYKDFLRLGASASPVDLLNEAGVNPLSKETYDYALKYFKDLVDEYETLVDAKLN